MAITKNNNMQLCSSKTNHTFSNVDNIDNKKKTDIESIATTI